MFPYVVGVALVDGVLLLCIGDHSHQAVCCDLCANDDWKQYVEQEHASNRWESQSERHV